MPKVGFNTKPYYNADGISNSIGADDIFNCYLEQAPEIGYTVRRKPGLVEWTDFGAVPCDGIYDWEAADLVLIVNNGNVYSMNSAGVATDITTDSLAVGTPVIWAEGAKPDSTPLLYMANGKLAYSENGANVVYPTDAGTPTTATHVVYLNQKFLANVPDTNKFLFTSVNPAGGSEIDPYYWSDPDNPLRAEAQGGDLIALTMYLQEIQAWGDNDLEIWQDDGITPFTPVPQAASHIGLSAQYSIAYGDNAVFAVSVIDGVRTVIKMTGRVPQVISEPISEILNSYDTISDAIGTIVGVGGLHQYLLQFPSEGKTWAYDIKSDVWVPWGSWDLASGQMVQYIGQHSVYIKRWNKHLITSNEDGKVYYFDRNTYTDGSYPIKSYRRTPWIDHGVGNRKRSLRLRIKIKRGISTDGSAFLRFRDNGHEEWSLPIELTLNPTGQRDFIIDLSRLGQYHSRQYEVAITDDCDLCLVWVEEDVQKLRF